MKELNHPVCEVNLIAAYIDGDLDCDTSVLFEQHLSGCEQCRVELNAHRLFICELDAAMSQNSDVSMPENFSRVVAARAVSDMRGVRSGSEHKKALILITAIGLIAFGLLGTASRQSAVRVGRRLLGRVFGMVEFLWTAFYDTVASLSVVSRVLSRKFVIESGRLGLLLVLLALAVFLLSRLISNYHRTGAIE